MLVPIQPSPPTTKEPHGLVVGMLDFYSDDLTSSPVEPIRTIIKFIWQLSIYKPSSPVEPIRSQFSKNNFLLFMGKDNIKGEIRDYGDSGVRSSSSSDSTLALVLWNKFPVHDLQIFSMRSARSFGRGTSRNTGSTPRRRSTTRSLWRT